MASYALSNKSANRLGKAIRKVEKTLIGNIPNRKKQTPIATADGFFGIVVDVGAPIPDTDPVEYEEDYSDNRYWIITCLPINEGDDTEPLNFLSFEDDDAMYQILTATNLSEYFIGSHSVLVGQPVWIHKIRARETPTVVRYFFDMAVSE